MSNPMRIAILGAESTGKTTLARALAQEFRSPWVPEYLRRFCDERGRTPRRDEQSLILETQILHEHIACREAERTHAPLVICDTAPLMTAVYSDYVFGDRALYARALEHHLNYRHTLLLENDIDWIADGLQRDGAHVREPIFECLRANLDAAGVSYSLIDENGHARTLNAMHVIDTLLKRTPAP